MKLKAYRAMLKSAPGARKYNKIHNDYSKMCQMACLTFVLWKLFLYQQNQKK